MKTYPGKPVPPEELRAARERAWSALMDEARREAVMRGSRRKVVAVQSLRRRGWVYVIDCGERDCWICRARKYEGRYL